jgi:hypothetical protein
MKWAGHVSKMEDRRNANRILGGRRTEGKAHLENPGVEDRTIRKLILKNCVGGGHGLD